MFSLASLRGVQTLLIDTVKVLSSNECKNKILYILPEMEFKQLRQ